MLLARSATCLLYTSISFSTIAPSYLREVLAVCHVWVFG